MRAMKHEVSDRQREPELVANELNRELGGDSQSKSGTSGPISIAEKFEGELLSASLHGSSAWAMTIVRPHIVVHKTTRINTFVSSVYSTDKPACVRKKRQK